MNDSLSTFTDQIRNAVAHQTALRIRGHGSKDFYGESLQGELLDTRGHRGITSYEPTELVVSARCGTPLTELEAALAEKGQCLAFEPPRFATSHSPQGGTVGGMVAAGLSGPSRASVGAVRDYVLGVQLINGRAEHLKVMPVSPAEATLVFEVDQTSALNQLHRWGAQPLPLNASCWVRDSTVTHAPELLFVRLRGAVAAVESACQKMLADLPGARIDSAQAAPDWTACRDMRLPFFAPPTALSQDAVLWRLSVPQTTPPLKLAWPQLVEWHGGLRWVWAPASAHAPIRQITASVGGSATHFKALSAGKATGVAAFDALSPAILQIHHRLKAEFDPVGIFNPGRLLPGL